MPITTATVHHEPTDTTTPVMRGEPTAVTLADGSTLAAATVTPGDYPLPGDRLLIVSGGRVDRLGRPQWHAVVSHPDGSRGIGYGTDPAALAAAAVGLAAVHGATVTATA